MNARVEIEGYGYVEATEALHDANWLSLRATGRLSDALAGTAAMAGDSAFADDFAHAYDASATAVLGGFDDLVEAFGNLAEITDASYRNHRRAEESLASTDTTADDPSEAAWIEGLYTSSSPTPPSVLGGDLDALPGWANVVLDHIEGFIWPDADTERLYVTGGHWRTAADDLADLAATATRAADLLLRERSPEVVLAHDALSDLAGAIGELRGACEDLAAICDAYAAAVEEQRTAILDLVTVIIRDAILIAAAGAILGMVTGGAGNAVAGYVNAGKVAAEAPRFLRILDALRTAAAGFALSCNAVRTTATQGAMRLGRFLRLRPAVAVTTETRLPTFLRFHEGGVHGGHTLGSHVGRTDEQLWARIVAEGRLTTSTFYDESTAAAAVAEVLARSRNTIRAWLRNSASKKNAFEINVGRPVGRVMDASGEISQGQVVRVVVVRNWSRPASYRLLTAYVK